MESKSAGGALFISSPLNNFVTGASRQYKIKGVYNTKFMFSDEFVFLTKQDMQDVFGYDDQASSVIVRLENFDIVDDYARKITGLNLGADVVTWEETAGIILMLNDTFDTLSALLGTIALFVAIMTLFIVLYISTISKKRQIGVLKAIGVNDYTIIASFIMQSMFYSLCGIFIGAGIMYYVLVPYFTQNPLTLPLGMVTLMLDRVQMGQGALVLFIISILSGYLPSAKVVSEDMLALIWGKT